MKRIMLLLLLIITIIYLYARYYRQDGAVDRKNVHSGEGSEVDKSQDEQQNYFKTIKDICGELCDLEKKTKPGEFLGTVSAKVDCPTLFSLDLINAPSGIKPPNWNETPAVYKEYASHSGKVHIQQFYWDDTTMGGGRNTATVYSEADVEMYINRWKNRTAMDSYIDGSLLTDEAANFVDVKGKTILVIGTQNPWLEAVLLDRGAGKIVTLEYGYFISQHPRLEFIRPKEFRERYLEGSLDLFDAIFTYSSLEHSGLGRYGDALNPWGDLITVAQAWCVSKQDAKLAIGVPTNVNGVDRIEFSAHRVYGPIMYPFLTTNWKFVWPVEERMRTNPSGISSFQPYFVFVKQ